jgi:hypothetical protein
LVARIRASITHVRRGISRVAVVTTVVTRGVATIATTIVATIITRGISAVVTTIVAWWVSAVVCTATSSRANATHEIRVSLFVRTAEREQPEDCRECRDPGVEASSANSER